MRTDTLSAACGRADPFAQNPTVVGFGSWTRRTPDGLDHVKKGMTDESVRHHRIAFSCGPVCFKNRASG